MKSPKVSPKVSIKVMVGLSIMASVAACNRKVSNGIPEITALSADQRARLQATADAIVDATQFKNKALQTRLLDAGANSEKRAEALKSIDANCVIGRDTTTPPASKPKVSVVKVRLASSGKSSESQCPMEFAWETTTTNELDENASVVSGKVELVMHYAPSSQALKEAFNVQGYDFSGKIESKVQGATVSYSGSARGKALVIVGGVQQSVSLGSAIHGTKTGEAANFTNTYYVVYRDGLFIEIRLGLSRAERGSAPVVTACAINGESADSKEVLSLVSKLGFDTRFPDELKD